MICEQITYYKFYDYFIDFFMVWKPTKENQQKKLK